MKCPGCHRTLNDNWSIHLHNELASRTGERSYATAITHHEALQATAEALSH